MAITDTRLLERKSVVGVCAEATPGTPATLAGPPDTTFGWIPCYEMSFTPEVGLIERDILSASLASEQTDSVGTQFARVTFKCDVMGSNDDPDDVSTSPTGGLVWKQGTPQWMLALRGCGFFNYYATWEDLTGASSRFGTAEKWNVWIPSNTPPEPTDGASEMGDGKDKQCTLTIVFWKDGRQYTIAGAMGNVTFSGTAGDLLYANFEFLGVLDLVEGSQNDPAGPFDSVTPTPLSRADKLCWAVNEDKTPPTSSWELNMNNTYDIYKDVNVLKAGSYACIYESKPTLAITTLAYDAANAELLANKMIEVTTGTFQTVAGIAGTSGTKVQQFLFGVPVTEINSLDIGEETGYVVENATCKITANGADLSDDGAILTAPASRSLWLAYGAEVESAFLSDGTIDDPTDNTA